MNKNRKIFLISTLAVFSLAIYGIITQRSIIFVTSILALFILSYYVKQAPVLLAGICLSLYSLPHSGWLFGRDSHAEAAAVVDVLNGSTIFSLSAGRFSATPLLYIHAAIVSQITNIGNIPHTQPRLLTTYIIPLFYMIIIVLLCYSILGIFRGGNYFDPISMLIVAFWIPLNFRTSFRRGSIAFIGYLLIVYMVYLLYVRNYEKKLRISILGYTIILFLVLSHHLTLAVSLAFLSITISSIYLSSFYMEQNLSNLQNPIFISSLITFGLVIFSLWYLLIDSGGLQLIVIISNIFEETASIATPSSLELGLKTTYSSLLSLFFSKWIYQFVLSIGVLLWTRYELSNRADMSRFSLLPVIFGVSIGILSIISWLTGNVGFTRFMDFLVVSVFPISYMGYSTFLSGYNVNARHLLILFALIGFIMIPPHAYSSQQPNYSVGEYTERYSSQDYATAAFANQYIDGMITADTDFSSLMEKYDYRSAGIDLRRFSNKDIRENVYLVVITPRNNELYYGATSSGQSVYIQNPDIETMVASNDKIYDTNSSTILK